ncbi:MAG: hypothetical protein LBG05_06920 [Treponema sp.]|jgi:hypothetical protein|nr:hypothetical protein [Treponema sp.]
MKTSSKICFLALAMIFSGNLAAQEILETKTNSNLLSYYDTELFQWSYSMFGGLALNFQNQSSVTMYGIKESMKNAFIQYEDTNQRYRSYRGKTIAGNILLWGGFATVLAGAYVPIFGTSQDNNNYENTFKISIGVMLGGLVTEIIGAFILQSGQENIFDAVNLYNRYRINDYK